MLPPDLIETAAQLVQQAGLTGDFTAAALAGGANNRAFRLTGAAGWQAVFKAYFRHPSDPRDRCGAEYDFTRFAWERGLRMLPQPLAVDPPAAAALYTFVAGQPAQPGAVDAAAVAQASAFVQALNAHRAHPDAARLNPASESCFTLAAHLQTVAGRVLRLTQLQPETPQHAAAQTFISGQLQPLWEQVRAQTEAALHAQGWRLDAPLDAAARCLSPSDFGFHNALRTAEDAWIFIDFEYAGWDDCAKLICDFFCQPAVPVPLAHWERFSTPLLAALGLAAPHAARIRTLLPVYQIKWCCIMLNEFLPAGAARRSFAQATTNRTARLTRQLDRAQHALAQIST